MTKKLHKKKIVLIVAAGLLLPFASLLLILIATWVDIAIGDPAYLSKEMHMSYQLSRAPECKDKKCVVGVEMSNHNPDTVHLDYDSTDSSVFAVHGVHQVFMIGKQGERCQLLPDDSTDMIGSYETRQVMLSCKGVFSSSSDIASLELFGTHISASISRRPGNL